ncbi:hypothetical protein UlMin_042503 [Ulmus minor]
MNILVWNVRGLGNTRTFQILHDHVQQFCPSLVFLSETLCSKSYLEQIRVKLNFSGLVTWEKEGRSGGLCLLWTDSVDVRLLSGSKGHIDAIISSPDNSKWRFTGMYGNPDTTLRIQFWDLLKRLGDSHSLPWLCGGDLNEILFDHEKKGGGDRASYLLRNFREAIEYCNLADLGFRGPKFTWCRGNNNSNFIQERLDRMLENSGWSDMFPNSIVHHLRLWGSDHRPLLIEVLKDGEVSSLGRSLRRGRFHFEEAWADEPECRDTILKHWKEQTAGNLEEVANKLHQCASDLLRWNLEKFRWLREEIKKKTIAFNQADRALSSANWRTHQRLERELEALKYKEERYWQQRSKDMWLKSGDRNSKFFHRKASARRAKNSIDGLFDSNEKWCADKEGIAHIAESYFTNLFSSSSPLSLDMDMVINSLETKVSPAMNEQLDGRFDAEDVRAAIFQMAPSKSPGADGMSALFFQKHWSIVGDEVTTACLGFLNEGFDLGSINETLITLLPKVKCPTHITEFRPISLCNVLYKITSKMLATRMRSVMDSIISEEQSAFIPGRLISANAIIGFECLHALKRRRLKKKGFLALKLDMAKAYDRVEWSFIREVMRKLGFSEGWIKKIMDCVTSVYYSLLINGEKVGYIRPSRGLRQGDPLSPYLFLLCAEGLSSLIHTFERTGQLQGMRCGTNGPTISHLFFADDSLLFLEASPASCYAIKEILLQYEKASGQLVNYSKSAVCFGPGISEEDIGRMVDTLGVAQVKCHEHYLGLPCFSGKNKSKLFASIKDRVWNKLCGWKSKLLSAGGREILTKAIIQAIPTYSMNMFQIPISLIKELHRLCARFWWGGDITKQKMHWCTWEQLCVHKKNGGMGFRDLRLFNKAILAKQAWRIHTQPSSLVARVLRGFYFTSSSFLQVKKSNAASFVWRSILWGRELFLQGARWKIGCGNDTYIYHDRWLPRDGCFKISSPRVLGNFAKVNDIITASGSWDSSLIRSSFHHDEAEAILSLPRPKHSYPDSLIWHYDKKGDYTVRSGYWVASGRSGVAGSSSSNTTTWWTKFWKLHIPPKIKIFIWKAYHDWIPTGANLANHGVPTSKICLLCNNAQETSSHSVWECEHLKVFGNSFPKLQYPPQCNMKELLLSASDCLKTEEFELMCILMWRFWFRRNKWKHEKQWLDDEACLSWARQHLSDYQLSHNKTYHPPAKIPPKPWEAPVMGTVKVNTDAAWCSQKKKFGLGAVIRDSAGSVLASVATPVYAPVTVAVAEGWALERGATLARQMGFSVVSLESDCLEVIKALVQQTKFKSELGHVLDNISDVCNSFDKHIFLYTPRSGNQVAHNLAKIALAIDYEQTWPTGPTCIATFVAADFQHISLS